MMVSKYLLSGTSGLRRDREDSPLFERLLFCPATPMEIVSSVRERTEIILAHYILHRTQEKHDIHSIEDRLNFTENMPHTHTHTHKIVAYTREHEPCKACLADTHTHKVHQRAWALQGLSGGHTHTHKVHQRAWALQGLSGGHTHTQGTPESMSPARPVWRTHTHTHTQGTPESMSPARPVWRTHTHTHTQGTPESMSPARPVWRTHTHTHKVHQRAWALQGLSGGHTHTHTHTQGTPESMSPARPVWRTHTHTQGTPESMSPARPVWRTHTHTHTRYTREHEPCKACLAYATNLLVVNTKLLEW